MRAQATDPQMRSNIMMLGLVLAGAVLAFAMFALIARDVGPERFGHFATIFNATSFLSVVAVFGQETLIGRSWNEYAGRGRLDLAAGALLFGMRNLALGVALVAGATIAGTVAMGLDVWVAVAAGCLLAGQALLAFATHASRPLAGALGATSGYEIVWRLATVVAVVVAIAFTYELSDADLLFLLAGGSVLAAAVQAVMAYRRLPSGIDWSAATYEPKVWNRRALRMWGAAILEATSQYADVVLIGLLIDPVAAGGYFAASRIANAFAKVTLAGSNMGASRISLLYFNRPRAELLGFIQSLALSTGGIVIAGMLAIVVLGPSLLSIFGTGYADEFPTLVVLSIGTAMVALCGPTPYMLLHTGHETAYTRTMAAALGVRLVLFVALTLPLGTLGAALAFTLVSVGACIVLNVICRRELGVDPSVLSIFADPRSLQGEAAK